MRKLINYFENPFADMRIALNRKKAFGEDSIERITVQNSNNQFTNLLNKTKAVQDALFSGITSLSTDRATRKARTQSTNSIIEEFKTRNSQLNAYFIATGINKLAVYSEFFPQGIQAFTRDVFKENAEQKMQTLLAAVTANTEIAGGAQIAEQYINLLNNYRQARSAQLNKTGQISTGMDAVEAAEIAWNEQMFSNLLTFAASNRNKPDNIKLYMDPTLLEHDVRRNTSLTGKMKGTITDTAGHPVKNAIVRILDGKMDNAHSNEDGVYLTQHLPIGAWQIEFAKGNRKINKQVEIKQGEDIVVDVVL